MRTAASTSVREGAAQRRGSDGENVPTIQTGYDSALGGVRQMAKTATTFAA